MKLLRLSLENWRSVSAREITFAPGITLIEGPNEIGKSTIIEALQLLIAELDSSGKQKVRAIQPVGQDVGSRVEAEIRTGDYHFVYSKTYNKNRQTVLKVLAPQAAQLTGREAHERVEQILQQTMDMALWQALLVEQGKEVAGAYLADSQGLARALDAAAGSAKVEQDDSALLTAAQREYEQYYTLKTGKPKFSALEQSLATARATVTAARAALAAVEQHSAEHERVTAELRRLHTELPVLQAKVDEYAAAWQAISGLKSQVTARQNELDAAEELLRAVADEQARRTAMLADIAAAEAALAERKAALEPLAQQVAQLADTSTRAEAARQAAQQQLHLARSALARAQADERHLQESTLLAAGEQKLARAAGYRGQLDAARAVLATVRIDADGLAAVRHAEEQMQIAAAVRSAAASRLDIRAEQALSLRIDGESHPLATGASLQRDVASQVTVQLPGYASITVTPSQSASEVETGFQHRRAELNELLQQYGVADLPAAIAAAEKRAAAERECRSWSDKLSELLQGETEDDLQASLAAIRLRTADYLAARAAALPLPAGLDEARALHESATAELAAATKHYETCAAEAERAKAACNQVDIEHKLALQEVAGFATSLQDRQAQLAQSRKQESDAVIIQRAQDRALQVQALQADVAALARQLDAAAPDTAQALLDNARAVADRALRDQQAQRERLAALQALLTQAQADGCFEALEAAERECAQRELDWIATSRRAGAAERLWQTLNRHRDAARKHYVKPLQDGVEQLGRIVFGPDFSVQLDDSWRLVERTLNGTTIKFDDLSIGAKEQLGILLRLAAARIVAGQGGVPLIIDDALGFSDPSRLATMGAAIAAAGQDCQVILLSCTPGRFMHVGSAEVVRL